MLQARSIFVFWAPLAATWLMMAAEGPFLAAVIARLAEPKANLAAYGVAYAFAILVESPVIMLMSASTALVDDAVSFRKLRNFTYALCAATTLAMLLLAWPPLFRWIAVDGIDLPEDVAARTHAAIVILLPWPAAIGYRRFFQGLLIRDRRTRRVAYGTLVRLAGMAATAIVLTRGGRMSGASIGAAALAAGVVAEAVASRWMVRGTVHRLLLAVEATRPALRYRHIARFYYPLVLTSVLGLAAQPVVTFFMGRARSSIESLAVLPVVMSLTFVFRALGLSYQEAAIALLGQTPQHRVAVARFALGLAMISSGILALIGFTPLAGVWFERISGLSPELARFAVLPTRILVLLPALSVLLSMQRAWLVHTRDTAPLTAATSIEIGGIAALLSLLVVGFDWVGAVAAAVALVLGRLAGNLFLAGATGAGWTRSPHDPTREESMAPR